jgi:hypothetical protein
MLGHRSTTGRMTVGADKGYDTRDFVEARHRGQRRVNWIFVFGLAVYKLVRIRNLSEATG